MQYTTKQKMTDKRRSFADLRYVIWSCINLRPEQMRFDDGFQLFLGAWAHEYLETPMAKQTFNSVLDNLHDRVNKNMMDDLRSFREGCLAVAYSGAFLGAQLDLTNECSRRGVHHFRHVVHTQT